MSISETFIYPLCDYVLGGKTHVSGYDGRNSSRNLTFFFSSSFSLFASDSEERRDSWERIIAAAAPNDVA